jgi:4-methylaminobutanoate oxidase (formaldehyde-forming)
MSQLPHEAKVVVIGGGIAGCSTAYHLANNGWNTVLIERDVLTSGTDLACRWNGDSIRNNSANYKTKKKFS